MITRDEFEEFLGQKPRSNADYAFFSRQINQVGDRYWFIELDSQLYNSRYRIFDWTAEYCDLPDTLKLIAQEYALKTSKGYSNPETGRLLLSSFTPFRHLAELRNFFKLLLEDFPDHKTWRSIPISSILQCIVKDLNRRREAAREAGRLIDSTGYLLTTTYLHFLRNFGRRAQNISPFTATLQTDLPQLRGVVGAYLKKIGVPYSSFASPKSKKKIPFHIASMWLAHIISEFSSDRFKYLRAHWIFLRKYLDHYRIQRTPSIAGWLKLVNTFYRYKDGELNYAKGMRKESQDFLVSTLTDAFVSVMGYVPSKEQIFKEFQTSRNDNRYKKTAQYLFHLYAAIALTSGARRSEIAYLRISDFTENTGDVSDFKSFIHKTNKGLPTIRSIAGFAHQMVSDCADIGPIDRRSEGVYLFYTEGIFFDRPKNIGRQATHFNKSYQSFLHSLPKSLAAEFRRELPTVSTHQARHLFAAFALRVSDGNVFEAIRKHFRHELGSQMTRAYTDHKISEDEAISVEREYAAEIISRIGLKEDHGYFGPMVMRIEKLISEHIEFWDPRELKKLSAQIDELSTKFHSVKVHEWGLCLSLNDSLTKSKCYNRTTKLPEYDKGSTFNNCASCIHLLSHRACKEDIERIGINAHETLKQHPILGNTIRKELEGTLLYRAV